MKPLFFCMSEEVRPPFPQPSLSLHTPPPPSLTSNAYSALSRAIPFQRDFPPPLSYHPPLSLSTYIALPARASELGLRATLLAQLLPKRRKGGGGGGGGYIPQLSLPLLPPFENESTQQHLISASSLLTPHSPILPFFPLAEAAFGWGGVGGH